METLSYLQFQDLPLNAINTNDQREFPCFNSINRDKPSKSKKKQQLNQHEGYTDDAEYLVGLDLMKIINKIDFSFPEGGWSCSKCLNYNFQGRFKCHRCKKTKTDKDQQGKPRHMF